MAYAPIFGCRERPVPGEEPPAPPKPPPGSADRPLELVDQAILALDLAGNSLLEISLILTVPRAEVAVRALNPRYLEARRVIEVRTVGRVAELTDVEPITRAKAAAPEAMGEMIRLSRGSADPRVRLKASEGILRYAGVEPPRKVELTAPDRLLDLMTPLELAALADRKLWPARFKDQLRHLLPAPDSMIDITPPSPQRAAAGSQGGEQADAAPPADVAPPEDSGGISEERLRQDYPDADK
jgi:hypothetical protein